MKRFISIFIVAGTLLSAAETLSVFKVPQMHCPLCTSAVKHSVKDLPGVEKVQVRLNTKTAKIWHDGSVSEAELIEAIATTGYKAVPVK